MSHFYSHDLFNSYEANCSLIDKKDTISDLLERVANKVLHRGILQRHQGLVVAPDALRKLFLGWWNSVCPRDKFSDKDYWTGPNAAAGVARRVFELVMKYEVSSPFEPYRLKLGEHEISGDYALLEKTNSRKKLIKLVVHPHLRKPRDVRVPHYDALASWLAARQKVDEVDLYLLHQPLVWGESWIDKNVNERLTRNWLTAIVEQTAHAVPRPGPYCTECSHPCRSVYDGPDDYTR